MFDATPYPSSCGCQARVDFANHVMFPLQAALPSAIGGSSSRAVIISSEGRFPVNRMQSMSKAVWRNLSKEQLRVCELQGVTRESLWSGHVIKEARTADDMVLACEQATRWLRAHSSADSASPAAALVLVDSIAAPFRTREEDTADASTGRDGEAPKRPRPSSSSGSWFGARTKALLGISSELRALATSFDVPVVITNQVTALVSESDAAAGGASQAAGLSASPAFTPALGLSWAHGMHIRMLLLRGDRRAGGVAAARRRLRLVFHPAAEPGEVLCELGDAGLTRLA
jgi:RecA/RadA recombinase